MGHLEKQKQENKINNILVDLVNFFPGSFLGGGEVWRSGIMYRIIMLFHVI